MPIVHKELGTRQDILDRLVDHAVIALVRGYVEFCNVPGTVDPAHPVGGGDVDSIDVGGWTALEPQLKNNWFMIIVFRAVAQAWNFIMSQTSW